MWYNYHYHRKLTWCVRILDEDVCISLQANALEKGKSPSHLSQQQVSRAGRRFSLRKVSSIEGEIQSSKSKESCLENLFGLVLWHINLCRLFNTKSWFPFFFLSSLYFCLNFLPSFSLFVLSFCVCWCISLWQTLLCAFVHAM